MTSKIAGRLASALTLVLASTACERGVTDLEPAEFPNAASVFEDGFGPGVDFSAFELSRTDALDIDEDEFFTGSSALRFDVPDAEDPSGGFVGGVFFSSPRNLTEYNALTFWAKASRTVTVEEMGFGLDDDGNSLFQTSLQNLQLTSSWQQFAIPIPASSALTREGGLFYLSEANQAGAPYSIWIDEVAYADLSSVGAPQAEMISRTVGMAVGDEVQAEIDLAIPVGGAVLDVQTSPAYYDWDSSDPSVATVSEAGLIEKVGEGMAEVTATLGSAPVDGSVTVEDGAGLAGVVFDDAFGAAIGFASFGDGAKTDAVEPDDTEAYAGSRSLRITIPGEGDPTGIFAGGVFRVEDPTQLRDLSGFNALTFWAKAATSSTFDLVGFGNDNSGMSQFGTTRLALPLTTEWQRFVIPIPDPTRLTAEGGLFTFAEGTEDGAANTIWLDEIVYMDLDEVGAAQPALAAGTFTLPVGETQQAEFSLTFPVGEETVAVSPDARYFAWASSDPAVATVSETGLITMVGEGSSDITATLAGIPAVGAITVQTSASVLPPTAPAADPTQDPADVISIYSDSYDDVPNLGFNNYGLAAFEIVDVAGSGNSALRYTRVPGDGGNFQVIELGGDNQIDAAAAGMTNFRFDLYFPNPLDATDQALFKLVDVGASNTTEALIFVNSASDPALGQGTWLSFDFPLDELTAIGSEPPTPIGTANIQQFVIDLLGEDQTGEVYVDNIYFYADQGEIGGPPSTPAADPTQDPADVISIYSDSYDDVPNLGFNNYGLAAFEIVDVAGSGNSALRYTRVPGDGGNFQVIELGGDNQIDAAAAGMTNLRFDLYFPNDLEDTDQALFKLVDIIPGDPATVTEALIFVNQTSDPALGQGTWLSFDLPLSELIAVGSDPATPINTGNIQQFVIDLLGEDQTGEVYIDNIYFYAGS